jgi:hypothetical protein
MPATDRRNRQDLVKTVTTDQYGHFAVRGLTPGEYKAFVWDDLEPNIYFDPNFMERYESQGRSLRVEEDGHISLNLRVIETAASHGR